MKKVIKKIIKALLPKRILASLVRARTQGVSDIFSSKPFVKRFFDSFRNDIFIYRDKKLSEQRIAGRQILAIAKSINVVDVCRYPYFYPYNPRIVKILGEGVSSIVSITLDYAKVLNTDLTLLAERLSKKDDDFSRSVIDTISAIDLLRLKAIAFYSKKNDERSEKISSYLERMMSDSPKSLDEALQKILFVNALLWDYGHGLVGLGRLDVILEPYYRLDVEAGRLTRDDAFSLITDFVKILGADTFFKSGALVGDTGQVILLSGTDRKGRYVENELTHIFLEVITELNVPDPKLILRVCDNTSDELWRKSVASISKGNGSPLMMNESKVMELMTGFGYDSSDVVDFGTSACWEPLIIGKSFDQNNSVENINVLNPINRIIQETNYLDYDSFEKAALSEIASEAKRITDKSKCICFDKSPLMSIWTEGCVETLTDFAAGGAKYNYHGFLCSGMPNAVNSLLNIKRYVFEEKKISYDELKKALANDYVGYEYVLDLFLSNDFKFGLSAPDVMSITTKVMNCLSDVVARTTINGHKAKLGFSSPAYLILGKRTGASADGRHGGDPFSTHISPVSKEVGFAEIIDFASELDYSGNKINGNVVDFVLSKQFVKNVDKFIQILKTAFRKGVFEMQLNVLNYEQLVAAKKDPTLYPNLVVRIWGFSAYFNDLPDSYKDMLIQRALNSNE